jgi:PhoPQ-activated pathogenicity-related protein
MFLRVVLVALLCAQVFALHAGLTSLDEYVYKDDGYFSYTNCNHQVSGLGWTAHFWNLTSQKWLTDKNVSRSVWWHHVAVIIPDTVNLSRHNAFVYITGGDNHNPNSFPSAGDEGLLIAATVATGAQTVAAVLWQVPNQPLEFPIDPFNMSRSEDAAIALTWWKFINDPSDPNWILEYPMTKAGVKCLDMLEAVFPQYISNTPINKFLVAGASKRGWTTWLVGAVEAAHGNRIQAIAPIVLDALNFIKFAHRQFRMYNGWSFALQDYYKMNFTQSLDLPNTALLASLIDPYWYRSRLTMPKLAINAGGDEFQMPDDQRHWAHDMPGEMHTLLLKNAEHSCATGVVELAQSVSAFLAGLNNNYPRPNMNWTIDEATGNITVTTDVAPTKVTIAYSDSGMDVSAGKRDFRWAALNVSFCPIKVFGGCVRPLLWTTTSEVEQLGPLTYRASFPLNVNPNGWRAFILEMQWPNPFDPLLDPFYFTSPASVVPPTYPFADCSGAGCKGELM